MRLMPHPSISSSSTPSCCCGSVTAAPSRVQIDWLLAISLALVTLAVGVHLAAASLPFALPTWGGTLAHAISNYLATAWWGIALGMFFAGLLDVVPREFVMAILGRRDGFRGVLRAAAAGVSLDLCSHGILLIGAKLYERGASIGQVLAFLIASPWNSLSLTLILAALIGWKWTLVFIALSLIVAIIVGVAADTATRRGYLPINPHRSTLPNDFHVWREACHRWHAARFDTAFFRRVAVGCLAGSHMIVRWLLLGIILAGLVQTFVPTDFFGTWFGPSLVGLGLTLVAATVIEICSEGSTPLAAELVTRAAAPGNGFAFLMAGVATDYTEVAVLRQVTGSWRIAFFLPLVTLPQVALLGWLLNHFAA